MNPLSRYAPVAALSLAAGCFAAQKPATSPPSSGSSSAPGAQGVSGYPAPIRCSYEGFHAPDGGELSLVGLEPVRRAVDEAARRSAVVALHIERRSCVVDVRVLACTRPAVYAGRLQPRAVSTVEDRRDLDVGSSLRPGNAYLRQQAGDAHALLLETAVHGERAPSWLDDLRMARFTSRWGNLRASVPPPLHTEELRGSDCAEATHWVSGVVDGTYRARRGATEKGPWAAVVDGSRCQPGACVEPIAIRLEEVWPMTRLPKVLASMPPPRTFLPPRCPLPIAGQPTEQAAAVTKLFDAGRWGDAWAQGVRVALGETGDDPGNRQIAEYQSGVALGRLHFHAEADAILRTIASSPCHVRREEAAFWLTVQDRRSGG